MLAWAAASPLTGARGALDDGVDAVFTRARGIERLTSLAIYRRGKLIRQMFRNGLPDERALTNVKSISKGILSILVGIALERQHLPSIEDPVAQYLPDKISAASRLSHLTLRHLLTMARDLVSDWG